MFGSCSLTVLALSGASLFTPLTRSGSVSSVPYASAVTSTHCASHASSSSSGGPVVKTAKAVVTPAPRTDGVLLGLLVRPRKSSCRPRA